MVSIGFLITLDKKIINNKQEKRKGEGNELREQGEKERKRKGIAVWFLAKSTKRKGGKEERHSCLVFG